MRQRPVSTRRAVEVLREHAMPTEEIRAVLSAEDPVIVHRYLELHRERLEERVVEQRRALESVEEVLTQAVAS
jgi:uncharacterized protein YutE (UPF0331/DUF86 family)